MGLLTRREDWPERLAAAVDAARGKPYVLGENDCWRLACAVIEALTGEDFWPRFAGYKTKRQALAIIARIAPSFGEAVTVTLGVPQSVVFAARRGDLLLFRDDRGEYHLGVVLGRNALVMAADGPMHIGLNHVGMICAWRIG